MRSKSTIEWDDFLEIALKVHNGFYSYPSPDSTILEGSKLKIEIVCPDHGSFFTRWRPHLEGTRCVQCIDREKWLPVEVLGERLKDFYENTLKFSYEDYRGTRSKIQVTCQSHGSFKQEVSVLLKGYGCRWCTRGTLHYDSFLEKARTVHGDIYSYPSLPKNEPIFATSRIEIFCSTHGAFFSSVKPHLEGARCRKCSTVGSKHEDLITKLLTAWGVNFEREWSTDTLRSPKGRKLEIDFALPKEKVLIEFDGPHHFSPVQYFNQSDPEESFAVVQNHDKLKNEWAEANGWLLFRFSEPKTLEFDLHSLMISLGLIG